MKKQLFLITLLMFVGFATFAQTEPEDLPPTCTANATNPAAGVEYTYEVSIGALTGNYDGSGTFKWYVTQNTDLLLGTAIIANNSGEFIASGAGAYNTDITGADQIIIEWTAAAIADGNPYYLVITYNEENETGLCNGNNVKVYRIMPQNTFWLAMTEGADVCAAGVSGANIVGETTNPTVEYLYGINTLTATITAGGYLGDWNASLQVGGFDNEQDVVIDWSSTHPTVGGLTTGAFTSPGTPNGVYTATLPSFTDNLTPATVCTITLTITVTNNHFENLDGQAIALAIDGNYLGGATTFNDKSDKNGACTDEIAFDDNVTQDILARPDVNPVNPASFVADPTTVTP